METHSTQRMPVPDHDLYKEERARRYDAEDGHEKTHDRGILAIAPAGLAGLLVAAGTFEPVPTWLAIPFIISWIALTTSALAALRAARHAARANRREGLVLEQEALKGGSDFLDRARNKWVTNEHTPRVHRANWWAWWGLVVGLIAFTLFVGVALLI